MDSAVVPKELKTCKTVEDMSIRRTPSFSESTDILFEGVIVEYLSCAGEEQSFHWDSTKFTETYLKTYVSVGIPTPRYNWLLKQVARLTNKPVNCSVSFRSSDYTWIPVHPPPNTTIDENITCYVYRSNLADSTPLGSLYDVVTLLKSNIIGFGQFTVCVSEDLQGNISITFMLTGFQMTNITTLRSYPKPCIASPPPKALMNTLKRKLSGTE